MKTPSLSFSNRFSKVTIVAATAFAVGMLLLPASTVKAAEASATATAEEKKPSMPLTATFEKVANAENGPFVLKLKNTSPKALKVTAKILLSVSFHAESKARKLPEQVIEPGKEWAIRDLSAADKVIITAPDFGPLEIVVQ